MKIIPFALLVLFASAGAGPVYAQPVLDSTPQGFRAIGITAGAETIWFGTTIDTFAATRRLTRHAEAVRDSDGDGIVIYKPGVTSRFSLVVVVDAANGAYAVHKGPGVDGVELDLRGNNWRSGLDSFEVGADFLDILLVRPGGGAWTVRAAEGGRTDGDRAMNGKFRLIVNDMTPIGGQSRPPGGVRRGDLLVIVEPQSLAYVIRPAKE